MFNFLKIIQLISFFSLFIIQSTFAVIDSTNSSDLNYPFNQNQSGGLFLNKPSNFSQQTIYSPKNNNYSITNKIGTFSLGNSTFLSFEQFWKRDFEEKNKPSITKDGVKIQLMMNAGLILDLPFLEKSGADGIGLYRTELQFLTEPKVPKRSKQVEFYARILDLAKGKPVNFRSLDIGSEKILPYLQIQW